MSQQLQHWSYEIGENQVVWLTIDRQDSSANSLNEAVLREFKLALDAIKLLSPKALIIRSAKKTGFIVGADIEQFKLLKTAEEATKLIIKGQMLFQELADLPFPTIALIQGFCLGGGLELALACRYRIVEDSPKVRLGLPEVKLGIHPGWGGTVRLPALIGASKAFGLLLTGQLVRPKAARKMGFVDRVVPRRLLYKVVLEYALKPPALHQASLLEKLSNQAVVRSILGKMMLKQVAHKARREHYPAPYEMIDHWVSYGVEGSKPYTIEAESIGRLLVNNAPNLVKVFFLQERLKNMAKKSDYKPMHVHVVGAGVMGGDIAAWCAFRGFKVTLQDQSATFIAGAMKRAYQLAKKRLKEPFEVSAMMDRLLPDVEGFGVAKADVIIEAITEKLEAKQALFQHLESLASPDAILATNTSTIPLEEIRLSLKNPERLVGIHYFNPVALMPLVEIVKTPETDPVVIEKAIAFVKAIDKLPLPVRSSPGFLVNRILLPYMLEAVSLLEEGVSGPDIDEAARRFGMPMGPIELADKVGLDVCLASLEKMSAYFGGTVPPKLRQLVEQGYLGEKTGRGFYHYKKGKLVREATSLNIQSKEIIMRLSARLVNESVACLREGIVEDADLLDAGSIFGFGFAPFRGGVISYARETGVELMVQQLKDLEARLGERFKPDAGWQALEAGVVA